MIRRTAFWGLAPVAAAAFALATAAPAGACGALVAANGTIQLTRTSTLAAYHDGVERYVTSFEFAGVGQSVGSIVPLPGIPTKVQRGGDWTLQRLEREVAPPEHALFAEDKAVANAGAQVILHTTIDALNIDILKGGGDEVGKWATDHGYLLPPDAPTVLDFYGSRSKIFMAARFDVSRAQQLGQNSGDGTPIMLTIPTKAPWVPLRILSLGLDKSRVVDADVFLLTDNKPKLLAGGPGLSIQRDESASPQLLDDLRSDKGMGWVPDHMWFRYLRLDVPAGQLDYDLAVSDGPGQLPSLRAVGVDAQQVRAVEPPPAPFTWWPVGIGVGIGAVTFAALGFSRRRFAAVRATS
ncbi:MAG TPA: DUF2330 domain-containing protein [Acidimicrobiia bacterium]|nr:DUF2330 domain-containing protein [Acidimicrobiia bacterium]